MILLFFLLFTITHACPTPSEIRQVVDFQTVIQQQPFDGLFAGMVVNNGVLQQQNGICNHTGAHCNTTVPCSKHQSCRLLSKQLIFNVYRGGTAIPPKNLTNAVQTAKQIVFTGTNKIPGLHPPNVLCAYLISGIVPYTCLPKYCNNQQCMTSTYNCTCVEQPCSYYYFTGM